ncbi:DUF305 domain-containing protein [Pseudonocardia halophobica]|uniref:DUF305 domain-containing protein n=1 Tax=Pseudonocardia halophobica TaxID=29401 RepID=UPI003D8BC53A
MPAAAVLLALLVGLIGGYLVHGVTRESVAQGAVDVGFVQDMIQHHQQAVVMSQLIQGRADPQIASLAQTVASDQLREIGRMEGYLDLWHQPSVPTSAPMAWMEDEPGGHHTASSGTGPSRAMPGTATQEELNHLGEAGSGVERRYLTLMIRHHRGAVEMADYASRHALTPQIRDFAAAISFRQQEEIRGMARLMERFSGR